MSQVEPKILVAGIGNIFLGDDGFGSEVVTTLSRLPRTDAVQVKDFGIRGFDLAYALMEPFALVILVDAVSRGAVPGTLYVLAPDIDEIARASHEDSTIDAHSLTPERALRLVYQLGGQLGGKLKGQVLIVGCEPQTFGSDQDPALGLSPPVQAAMKGAISLIESLILEYFTHGENNATSYASQ